MSSDAIFHRDRIYGLCDKRHRAFQQKLEQRSQELLQDYQAQVEKRLEGLRKERVHAQAKLNAISVFQFSQRKSAWAELERLDRCIAEYSGSAAMQHARLEHLRKIQRATASYRTKLDAYLARRFPGEAMRKQAQQEFEGWYLGSNSQMKDLIYAQLQKKPGMTQAQLQSADPVLAERSAGRMEYVLREMVSRGELSRKKTKEELCYYPAGSRTPKTPKWPQVDAGYEDAAVAAQPIPEPPAIDAVL